MTPTSSCTRPSRMSPAASPGVVEPEQPREVAMICGHAELGPGDTASKRVCNAAYRSLAMIYVACENAPIRKIDLAELTVLEGVLRTFAGRMDRRWRRRDRE